MTDLQTFLLTTIQGCREDGIGHFILCHEARQVSLISEKDGTGFYNGNPAVIIDALTSLQDDGYIELTDSKWRALKRVTGQRELFET